MTDQYRKQNSFVGFRRSGKGADVRSRLIALRDRLALVPMDPSHREIVSRALADLLAEDVANGPGTFRLHDNVEEEIARLPDVDLPRYLHYRYRYETAAFHQTIDNFPPSLQIEPVSRCNYRCVFCYQTDKTFTDSAAGHMGMISEDMFRKAVDECEGNVEAITLASRGEPLLHPKFDELMAYTRGKFLALKINTNASLLDEYKSHAILDAEPQTVVFSADAAAETQYSRFRVGGRLCRVLENVRLFQQIRAVHYPQSRTLTRVSGVKVLGTPSLEEMVAVWGDFVDQVAFVDYNPWQNTYERPINDVTEACTGLWFRMFLWWDGRVNPCDNDYLSHLNVGRFPESSLSSIWKSDRFSCLRTAHASGKRRDCHPCQRCPVV